MTGKTELYNGTKSLNTLAKGITDQQRKFCHEYVLDYNINRAALAAGCGEGAKVTGCRWLKKPEIARYIGYLEAQSIQKLELTHEDVLRQLYFFVKRDVANCVDEDGVMLNVRDMPEKERASINGFKQKVKYRYDEEGKIVERNIETEVRLVAGEAALDLAMKNKGLFAAKNVHHEHNATISWDAMIKGRKRTIDAVGMEVEDEPKRIEADVETQNEDEKVSN
jgi:phage terminase small subunit